MAHLKLALSIHSHPSFTTQRASTLCSLFAGDVFAGEQGSILSGSKYPLSLGSLSIYLRIEG